MRAAEGCGSATGNPRCVRIFSTTARSWIVASKRSRPPQSGQARICNGRDAGDDAETEADGERGKDAAVSRLGRELRVSGVHHRALLLEDGEEYIGTKPSQKTIARVCGAISELTEGRWGFIDTEDQVGRINRTLEGWSNYFRLGPVSKAYRAVDRHTAQRLRQWLRRKHKVRGAGTTRYSDHHLYQRLNLVRLEVRTRNFAWAKA